MGSVKQGMVVTLLSLVVLFGVTWAVAEEKSEILATVGDESITLQDFAKRYPALVSWFGMGAKPDAVQTSLEQMILGRLLSYEARQSGLENQPEIQAQITDVLTRAYLKSRLPLDKVKVEEGEGQSYYEQNVERFRIPPRVRIAHILVGSEAEAQAIRQAVQNHPEAFGRLARERSLDPASASQGGALGWVIATRLTPGLAEAVMALAPGQVSEVIKTAFGYHLVKLEESPPPQYIPYTDVQQQIEQDLLKAKRAAVMRSLQDELWAKYNVVIHQDVLQTVVQEPAAQGEGEKPQVVTVYSKHQPPAGSGPQPRLQLLSAVNDLGSIPAETITHTFLVTNSGDAELSINRVHTDCKCVKASVNPTRLAPGQTGQLTVTYDPNYFQEDGQTRKGIFLESNDAQEPRQLVALIAEIVRGQMAHEQR